MTNLDLSEEREQFQKLAREFAEGEITPIAENFDRTGEFPEELVQKAWEIGLVNFQIPESYNGLELANIDSCIILEELAAGCSGIAAAIEISAISQLPLLKFGSDAQKEKYLKPLLEDCRLGGYASQDASVDEVEVTVEQGNFVLNGHHTALYNGGMSEWYFLVASHADGDEATAFIIPADSPGITFGDEIKPFGRRARAVSKVEFKNLTLKEENVLGEPGNAFEIVTGILPEMYCFIASGAVGVAQKALEHAIQYSKERETFGRPIAQHQGVAFMLAEMAREIKAARYLTWQTAQLIDEGKDAYEQSLIAKAYSQEAAMRVTTDAVQIYGGYGYSKEYPVEKLMRDAKIYQLCEQSPQELKASLARELVGCA